MRRAICTTVMALALAAPGLAQFGNNALKLRGRNICVDAPADAQVLAWNNTSKCWGPAAAGAGDMLTASFVLSGAGAPANPCTTAGAWYRNTSTTPYTFWGCPSAGGNWVGPFLAAEADGSYKVGTIVLGPYTVGGTLPAAASGNSGWITIVTNSSDCQNATPGQIQLCRSNGTIWAALGGGSISGFTAKGTYSAGTSYTKGDLVGYGTPSVAYVALQDCGTCAQTPGGAPTYWATPGPTGPAGSVSVIASGTATLGTDAIAANSCASVVQPTASAGDLSTIATTDVISATANADLSGVTGYGAASTDGLIIYAYPSSAHVNFKVCNATGSSITPGAATLNWKVMR